MFLSIRLFYSYLEKQSHDASTRLECRSPWQHHTIGNSHHDSETDSNSTKNTQFHNYKNTSSSDTAADYEVR